MKKLLESLKSSVHPGGTYSAIIPSRESAEMLFAYMVTLGIDNLEDKDEYHCTLIYSKTACPDIAKEDFDLPCEAIPKGFSAFGKDEDTLVLEIYCPNAKRLQNVFKDKYGATSDFPDYKAHITVAKDFKGELPTDVPDFNIEFTGMMIEELG